MPWIFYSGFLILLIQFIDCFTFIIVSFNSSCMNAGFEEYNLDEILVEKYSQVEYCGIITDKNGPFAEHFFLAFPGSYFTECVKDAVLSNGDLMVIKSHISYYYTIVYKLVYTTKTVEWWIYWTTQLKNVESTATYEAFMKSEYFNLKTNRFFIIWIYDIGIFSYYNIRHCLAEWMNSD